MQHSKTLKQSYQPEIEYIWPQERRNFHNSSPHGVRIPTDGSITQQSIVVASSPASSHRHRSSFTRSRSHELQYGARMGYLSSQRALPRIPHRTTSSAWLQRSSGEAEEIIINNEKGLYFLIVKCWRLQFGRVRWEEKSPRHK